MDVKKLGLRQHDFLGLLANINLMSEFIPVPSTSPDSGGPSAAMVLGKSVGEQTTLLIADSGFTIQ